MKYKILVEIGLIGILLTGCATETSMTQQNGQKLYRIECNGKLVNMSVCYNEAQKLCPSGYTIVNNNIKAECTNYLPGLYLNCLAAKKMSEDMHIKGVFKGIIVKCK